jgi:hypothetical protein
LLRSRYRNNRPPDGKRTAISIIVFLSGLLGVFHYHFHMSVPEPLQRPEPIELRRLGCKFDSEISSRLKMIEPIPAS